MKLKRYLRLLTRLTRLTGHILWGFGSIPVYRLRLGAGWYRTMVGQQRIQRWMQTLNSILGMTVHVTGNVSTTPCLLVANHISWLDIPALASITTGAFVAKSDVRSWPLLGNLADQSGTLFLTRNSLSGMRALMETLQSVMQQGVNGIVFPEGTSTDGREVKPFFPAMFQAAISADVPIQAVAIRYYRAGQRDTLAPFIDDDAFFSHLLKIVAAPQTQVYIEFAQPMAAQGCSRQLAARVTHYWVENKLIGRRNQRRCREQRAA